MENKEIERRLAAVENLLVNLIEFMDKHNIGKKGYYCYMNESITTLPPYISRMVESIKQDIKDE